MIFSNKVYNLVKYLVMIAIPAFSAAYYALAGVWDLPDPEKVVVTLAVIAAMLGTLVGISSHQYAASGRDYDGIFDVTEDPGGMKSVNLVLPADPEELLLQKDKIVFKVVKTQGG